VKGVFDTPMNAILLECKSQWIGLPVKMRCQYIDYAGKFESRVIRRLQPHKGIPYITLHRQRASTASAHVHVLRLSPYARTTFIAHDAYLLTVHRANHARRTRLYVYRTTFITHTIYIHICTYKTYFLISLRLHMCNLYSSRDSCPIA
jgi:hypothetical protein